MKKYLTALSLVLLLAASGCGHFSTPFWRAKADLKTVPEEALRAVAKEIEEAVHTGNREPEIADRDGIIVNTPEIKQAIRMRAARNELLQEFLETGNAYEKPNGHIYVLISKEYKKSTTRRQRDRDALLVGNEAQNRWTIYEGIIEASHLGAKARSALQQIFYEIHVEMLAPGQKYETPEGEVVSKSS